MIAKTKSNSMIKNYFFLLVSAPLFFSSCVKVKNVCKYTDTNVVAPSSEIESLQAYFASNGITNAVQHPSGFFYTINNPGTGATASLCNTVVMDYKVYQLGKSTPFDHYDDPAGISFLLGDLIEGVKKATPFIKAEGSITIYIPPSLGYGNSVQKDQNGNVILPANSYLKFDMSLIAVW